MSHKHPKWMGIACFTFVSTGVGLWLLISGCDFPKVTVETSHKIVSPDAVEVSKNVHSAASDVGRHVFANVGGSEDLRKQLLEIKDQRISELEARLKAAEAELQARSQPGSGARLKILIGGLNHRSPEEDKDNLHFNIAGMTYDVPFRAPNKLLDIQLLPRQLEDWNKLDEAKVIIQPDEKSATYFFRGSRPAFIEYYTIILYR